MEINSSVCSRRPTFGLQYHRSGKRSFPVLYSVRLNMWMLVAPKDVLNDDYGY